MMLRWTQVGLFLVMLRSGIFAISFLVTGTALALGAGFAAAQGPAVTITASGPAAAKPGDSVTYQFSYVIEGGVGTDIAATWHGDGVTYVSQRVVSGGGRVGAEPAVGDATGVVRWSLPQGSGIVELALQIPPDSTGRAISVGAYVPGTGTAASNTVTTAITAATNIPAAPPATGGSGVTGGAVLPPWLPALALAAALAAAAAAAWQLLAARPRS